MERHTGLGRGGFIIRFRAIEYDEFAGYAISLYIILNILNVASMLFSEAFSGHIMTVAIGIVFLLFMLVHYNHFIPAIKKAVPLYMVFFAVLIFSLLNGTSGINALITRFLWLFIFGLPLFGILSRAINTTVILEKSSNCIYFTSAIALLTIVQSIGKGIKGDYSMALGYALLYPTLLLIRNMQQRKKIKDVVMLAINSFVIVSFGSRGQILCIGVFLVFYLLFDGERVTAIKVVKILVVVAVGFYLYFNLKSVLRFAIQLLGNIGIKSRSLGYFLERINYTGREVVWDVAFQRIKEKPFLGWGLGIDISQPGFYPHQLFLEFLLHYGYIVGGVISLYIIMQVIKNIVIYREHDVLTLIFFCYGFVPLMVTSEYLVWPSFWAFVGLCVGRKKRAKGVSIL